jgi:acyl-coenzyme A thioesterase PaaI-like protein
MAEPEPQTESTPAQRERRAAMERLAAAARAFNDAAGETAVEPEECDAIAAEIADLTARLQAARHEGPYSGLTMRPTDYTVPEEPMPMNPIIGACNPARPDVHLRMPDGRVEGRAVFARRFTGPPGFVHGGITAMIADQLVALAPLAIGIRPITRALHVHYRRPVPLHEELDLVAECVPVDESYRAMFEIRHDGKVLVEGDAELVSWEQFAARNRKQNRARERG